MPISIDWGTRVITIPKSYLTHITGTLYELDTDKFRLDLKSLEDDEEGMPFPDTHRHNAEVTVAGVTYAQTLEIINGYSITFEDGQYSVRLAGSNNNFFDVENGILNQNQVQVISTNSAGLQIVTQGSGVTEQDKLDIADRVWDEPRSSHTSSGTFGEALANILKVEKGRWKIVNNQMIIYDEDGTTPLYTFNLKDSDGQPTEENVMERAPV